MYHRYPLVLEYPFKSVGVYLEAFLPEAWPHLSIGWERFLITERTARLTQAPWSLEVIGMTRYIALRNGYRILTPAAPGDRDLGQVEMVDALGWCPRGMRDDGMSACQHLLAWMLRSQSAPQYVRDMIASRT